MKSKIYNFSVEELKNIINSSNTKQEVLIKIGMVSSNGSRPILERIVKEYGLEENWLQLENRCEQYLRSKHIENIKNRFKSKYTYDDIFCVNSKVARKDVKSRIIKDNLIEYKCAICGISDYNGKPLSLQLDHINGINNDNRLENLRFLCPNCHSQTETYAGKNSSLRKKKENKKEELILKRKEILDSLDTTKYGWVQEASRLMNISHTQVRRFIKKYYPEFNK